MSTASPQPGSQRPLGRLWLRAWQAPQLAVARQQVAGVSEARRLDLRVARAIVHFADGIAEPVEAPPFALQLPAVIILHREALLALARYQAPDAPTPVATAALDKVPAELSSRDGAIDLLRPTLTLSAAELARRPADEQQRVAEAGRALIGAWLELALRGESQVRAIGLRRLVLVAAVAAFVLVVGLGGYFIVRGPNILDGRAWRTSSMLFTCHPEQHDCGGSVTDIFFCTAEDESPWIEYDLGGNKHFTKVVVKNRTDCCSERAVPLVLEASDDRTTWRQLAIQSAPFKTWSPSLGKERARYLRLRVPRRSFLHLEAVEVYR